MELKVRFKLNKQLDIRVALEFLHIQSAGVDFSYGVTEPHPELERARGKTREEQGNILRDYFDGFYEKQRELLKSSLLRIRQDWLKDEVEYRECVSVIFKKPKLPPGRYLGYLSIVNCNPRFLDDKTFQVFYKHPKSTNYVVAHELLHFFFYDYATRCYPDLFRGLDPNRGAFWDLAEIFNVVVMGDGNFVSGRYAEWADPYPAHGVYIEAMRRIWEKNPEVDIWIPEAYAQIRDRQNTGSDT